jgi:hypothetical protein
MTQNDPHRDTKDKGKARNIQWTLKRTMTLLGFLAFVVAILAATTVLRKPPGERAGAIVFYLLFGLLMFFMVRFEKVNRAFDKFYASYLRFTVVMLLAFGPLVFFAWLQRFTLEKLPLWAQFIIFLLWGVLLGGALWLIATKARRDHFLATWQSVSLVMPVAYSVFVLMLALLFFSTVAFVMTKHGLLSLKDPTGRGVTSGSLTDFFLWHFLEAIPLLKVNETLRWPAPLTYESAKVGWVLLLFKVVVIVPVIGAFASFWRKPDGAKKH